MTAPATPTPRRCFDLEAALRLGMVPLVVMARAPERTLGGYVDLYLQQEVKAEALVRRLDDFSRFLEVASFSRAQLLNVAEIARECVASRNTVESYLGILEDPVTARASSSVHCARMRYATSVRRVVMKSLRAYSAPGALVDSEPVRLAKLLSLNVSKGFDEVALARKVAKGLPPRSVTALIEALDLDDSEIIGSIVPRSTLQRRKKDGRLLSREHSERLYRLGRVIDAVGRAYHGDREQIKGFLNRPHQMLAGDTPLDLARSSSAGAEAVLSLLHSAEAGVAV